MNARQGVNAPNADSLRWLGKYIVPRIESDTARKTTPPTQDVLRYTKPVTVVLGVVTNVTRRKRTVV